MLTKRTRDFRYPFLIVETKSYATSGASVYNAQNQAVVFGASALEMLLRLGTRVGDSTNDPFVFSICTQGPHLELWVHYTTIVDGIRRFNRAILTTAYSALEASLHPFVEILERVLSWGRGQYLDGYCATSCCCRAQRQKES